MNKEINEPGIYQIFLINPSEIHDWSFLEPYSEIVLSQFYQGVAQNLPFTQETISFENIETDDENGYVSDIKITGNIRKNQEINIKSISKIFGNKKIVELFFMDGRKYLVGSKKSPATITYSEKNDDVSKKEINFSITCNSLHGVIIDKI